MRFLLFIFLLGCGTIQVKKNVGETPSGIQYCTSIDAQFGKQVHKIYACTPSLKLCKFAVQKAKDYGTMLELKSVTECKEIKHP